MSESVKIQNALISVFYKDGLEPVVRELHKQGVIIYSTGGTQEFIEKLGIPVVAVESLTGYPSILGGRVKTLHPKVFGGILARRENAIHRQEAKEFEIPMLDLVIVDLYPFEETVKSTSDAEAIIEKIDIGGVSLIRAAAKNFNDTAIVCDKWDFATFVALLQNQHGSTTLAQRRQYATKAFHVTSHYDSLIYAYFDQADQKVFKVSIPQQKVLRYGENPHQKGVYYGKLDDVFTQLHGKELSYNNLVDVEASVMLVQEFSGPTFTIIKHTNPCGVAERATVLDAWKDALAGDPVSAFGGVIACNATIDATTAQEIDKLFFEVLSAPAFDDAALEILKGKKNRILLQTKNMQLPPVQYKSLFNGVLVQDKDLAAETREQLQYVTHTKPDEKQIDDLFFAARIVKHAKSNTIVMVKNKQLVGIGCGHTSRIDALHHAVKKSAEFGFNLKGAAMASDAFFPFPDCVEEADKAGVSAVIQPGGSIKDQLSIDYCNRHNMAMVFTGLRHFKH